MIAKNNKNFKMKKIVTIMFLFCAVIATAQKKQFKKIAKAVDRNDIAAAMEIFNTLNENEIEADYKDEYAFYNAFTLFTNATDDVDQLLLAMDELKKAEELGFDDEVKFSFVESLGRQLLVKNASKLANSNPQKALSIVKKLASFYPDDHSMKFNTANLAYSTGEFEEALFYYEELFNNGFSGEQDIFKATRVKDGKEEIFPNKVLVEAAIAKGEYKNLIVEKSPSNRGVIVSNLIWLYKNSGQDAKAKEVFVNAFDRYPNDESLKINKADMYLTLGMMDEYKKATEALVDEVSDPKVFDNLGLAAVQNKNYDEAIKYFNLSLSKNPNNFVTLYNLGAIYLEKGNLDSTSYDDQEKLYKSAIDVFEKALKIKPENANVKGTLLSLYGALEMQDKIDALQGK
ncbi:hypothetical protein AAT17_12420 [Nonlabens sp. MIC269]|nr:hypothetical protein AAT17_12420 [Nonlabens sp. MIC269]